jgi:hypothetical protein
VIGFKGCDGIHVFKVLQWMITLALGLALDSRVRQQERHAAQARSKGAAK